ncbi:hypothetical protein G7Z17_g11979 [Cylindrodendrum hubeiense]|uniref:Uncharacterized protein n=1 Tax=Cylindrodendrum hubeiense TaxID=595255 RepID=A0A9P5H1T1_9HYPO|nr:hypothetical protein G7Z17_g11979 [Cylindrodendrum hubeiense]
MTTHQLQSPVNGNVGHTRADAQQPSKGFKDSKSDNHLCNVWPYENELGFDHINEDRPPVSVSTEVDTTAESPPIIPSPMLDALIDELISEWSEDSKPVQNHPPKEQAALPAVLGQGHLLSEELRWKALVRQANGSRASKRRYTTESSAGIILARGKNNDDDFFTLTDWLGRTRRFVDAGSRNRAKPTRTWLQQGLHLSLMMPISFFALFLMTQFVWPFYMNWVATPLTMKLPPWV